MRDFYRVLGVGRDADQKTISKAYKALAKRLHPDVNPSGAAVGDDATASNELRDVIEAYQVLSKPDKRAAYDAAWNSGRAGLNRRSEVNRHIVMAAVVAMTVSVTMASLAVVHYWRPERQSDLPEAEANSAESIPSAVPAPRLAETIATVPKSASHPVAELGASSAAKAARDDLPTARTAATPPPGELESTLGPLRVARAVSAMKAPKVGEVTEFDIVKTKVADFGPEPAPMAAVEPPRPRLASGSTAASVATAAHKSLPLPQRPPATAPEKQDFVFTEQQAGALIAKWYLSSDGRDRRTLHTLYCPQVDFWGRLATNRSAVIDQITEFAARWPRRVYNLEPGSLEVTPTGRPLSYQADFKYEFSVSGVHGFDGAAGRAKGRLIIERQHGRWRICAEDGRVLKRHYPYSGADSNASKYASSQPMDAQRILSGD